MPIDAMIPLMGKPMNVMSPFQVEAGAQQIQAGQNQNALSQLSIAQKQQEMQGVNALRQVFSDPSSLDPSTGQLTENALRKIYAVDPRVGQQVSQQMQTQALHKSQLEHNLMLTRQAEENIRDKKQKAMLELLPTINDITIQMNEAHDKAAAAGNPDPKQAALAKGKEVIDRLAPLGLLGGQEDEIRAGAARYDRAKADTVVASIRDQLAKQKSGEGDLYVDGQGNRFKVDKQGMVSIFREGQYRDFRGVLPKDIQPLKQPSTMLIQERSAAQAAGKAEVTGEAEQPTDDTLQMDAYRYLTDGTLPTNMGRGIQGAAQATKIRNEASRIAKDMGMEPDEIRLAQLTNKAQVGAIAQLARARAQILQFEKTAEYNSDLALKASKDAARSGVPLLNRGVQWAQENLAGDPKLRQFTIANETFINEYARVMSGGYGAAQTTEGAQQRAHSLLNRAATEKEYEVGVNQLRTEMKNRVKALDTQMQEERNRLFTGVGKPTGASATPESSPKVIKFDDLK